MARPDQVRKHGGKYCSVKCSSEARRVPVPLNGSRRSPEKRIWEGIKRRCLNKSDKSYADYGGRGITICAEWCGDFQAFLAHVGPRPGPEYSIDRYPENNGNYEPGNVRWATMRQQSRNKRTNHLLTHNGRTLTMIEWSEVTGIPLYTIRNRVNRAGWSAERALTEPVGSTPLGGPPLLAIRAALKYSQQISR